MLSLVNSHVRVPHKGITTSRYDTVKVPVDFIAVNMEKDVLEDAVDKYSFVWKKADDASYLGQFSKRQSTDLSKNRNPSRISMLSWKSLAWAMRKSSLSVAKKHLGLVQWKWSGLTARLQRGSGQESL